MSRAVMDGTFFFVFFSPSGGCFLGFFGFFSRFGLSFLGGRGRSVSFAGPIRRRTRSSSPKESTAPTRTSDSSTSSRRIPPMIHSAFNGSPPLCVR